MVALSAFRENEESWRIERLRRVYRVATSIATLADAFAHDPAMWEYAEVKPWADAILSLRDEKGMLIAVFSGQSEAEEFAPVIQLAWRSENESLFECVSEGS